MCKTAITATSLLLVLVDFFFLRFFTYVYIVSVCTLGEGNERASVKSASTAQLHKETRTEFSQGISFHSIVRGKICRRGRECFIPNHSGIVIFSNTHDGVVDGCLLAKHKVLLFAGCEQTQRNATQRKSE